MSEEQKLERILDKLDNSGLSVEEMLKLDANLEKSKRPFESIYQKMVIGYAAFDNLDAFVRLGAIDKEKCKSYENLLIETKLGVDYLHFTTMKFKFKPAETSEGMIRTMFAGYLGGAVTLGPPGMLVGALGGLLVGAGIGSPVFHAWNKTVGVMRKEESFNNLEDNFDDLYDLALDVEHKIKNFNVGEDDLKKLSWFVKRKFVPYTETALAGLKNVKEAYKEYDSILAKVKY